MNDAEILLHKSWFILKLSTVKCGLTFLKEFEYGGVVKQRLCLTNVEFQTKQPTNVIPLLISVCLGVELTCSEFTLSWP